MCRSFFLDEDALESIMSTKEIKDKPVCIVSVAGIKGIFSNDTLVA